MKLIQNLSFIAATLLIISAPCPGIALAAGEPAISSIPLLSKQANVPPETKASAKERAAMSVKWIGSALINDAVARKTARDMFRDNGADLKKYFPTLQDQERFIDGVGDWFSEMVGEIRSLDEALKAIEFLSGHIAAKLTDRVLLVNGVKDANRRTQWGKRFQAQVAACISRTQAIEKGALPCAKIMSDAVPANIGLAMVHEIGHQSLASMTSDPGALLKKMDAEYRQCVSAKGFTADVETCVRKSIKNGIVQVVRPKVKTALKPQFPNHDHLDAAVGRITAKFETCVMTELVTRKGDEKAVQTCVDGIVPNAGAEAIREQISLKKAVAEAYPGKEERKKLADSAESDFRDCMEEQRRKGTRDKEGLLLTDACEALVTNNLTYSVVLRNLEQSARETLVPLDPKNSAEAARISTARQEAVKTAKTTMDGCWKKQQGEAARESCLRATVKSAAGAIAGAALEPQLTADFQQKFPNFKNEVIGELRSCLDKQLPANISEAKDLDARTEKCAGALRRSAALALARFQIRGYLEGQVENELIEPALDQLEKGFAKCLGPSPKDAVLNPCILGLTRDAAKHIAALRFPKEIRLLLPPPASKKEENHFQAEAAKATAEITKKFGTCVDSRIAPDRPNDAEKAIDTCTKHSVQQIALFVANLQIDSKVAGLYGSYVKGLERLKQNLNRELMSCMQPKEALELDAYIKAVRSCGDRVSERAILYIARDQLYRIAREIRKREEAGGARKPSTDGAGICADCPPSGNEAVVELAKQSKDMMKSMAEIIGIYVDYDLKTAKQDIRKLIKRLNEDLEVTGTPATRKSVVDWLIKETSVLDQVLRAMVQDQIREAFKQFPANEAPPAGLVDKLTTQQAMESLFESPRGQAIVKTIAEEILAPVITGEIQVGDDSIKKTGARVTNELKDYLVDSREFGNTLIQGYIQPKLDQVPWLKKDGARTLLFFKGSWHKAFGKDTFKWDAIRETRKGQAAEELIREKIVRPKVKGETLTPEQQAQFEKQAEELIQEAILSRKK